MDELQLKLSLIKKNEKLQRTVQAVFLGSNFAVGKKNGIEKKKKDKVKKRVNIKMSTLKFHEN